MMSDDFEEPPSEFYDEYMDMLHESLSFLINVEPDAQKFIEMYTRFVLTDYFTMFKHVRVDRPDEKRHMARMFAIQIWNNTPLPSNHYRPRPLSKPQRNDPCFCGSGKKYKQCCLHLDAGDVPVMHPDMMTQYLLEVISKTELKQVWQYLPHPLLASIAVEWGKESKELAKRGLLLLDPIFKQDDAKLDHRDELAFDALAEMCIVLNKRRKRITLVKRMMQHPDKALQVAALHRYCCILGDQGKGDEAWAYFQKAQRLDPDNPSLSHLEILLLMQQGKIEQMRQRGSYWLKRLRKMNHEGGLDELIAMINEIITDTPTAMGNLLEQDTPGAARLIAWIKAACQTRLPPLNKIQVYDDVSVIEPVSKRTTTLEHDWVELLLCCDDPWENSDAWLEELEKHPELAGSSIVIEDLIWLVQQLDTPNPTLTFKPLLVLSMLLLKGLLPEQPKAPLKWEVRQNRSVLQVLGFLIDNMVQIDAHQDALAMMEWALQLNPNDNQGFRSEVVNRYLRLNRDDQVIELCKYYSEDFDVSICFGRALALFREGKRQLADTHLQAAIKNFPKVANAITRKSMKEPGNLEPGLITCGGDDEAWYYRQDARDLWVNTPDAIAWMKQCIKNR